MQVIVETLIRYLNGLWQYRWRGILAAWIVCVVGWISVLSMPDIYEAKSRFYVDASSRLREVVQTLGMEPDVSSRVFLVRQAMLGRPQLEKVARETDLDLRASTPEQYEKLIYSMRDKISISTGKRAEAQNLFAITYTDSDRKVALNIVSALLNNFLDDVLKQKDSDTEQTESFLKEQLAYYRQLLEDTERSLETFKKEHAGFVVGDRGDYFARMQEHSRLLDELKATYQVETGKRDELRRQLNQVNPYVTTTDSETKISMIPGSETSARIASLERQRRDLLLRATERHPDVIAIKDQIHQLRQQLKIELEEAADSSIDGARSATNPVYVEIQIALSNTNLRLTELSGEIRQLQSRLTELQNEVNSAPELEGEYIKLSRDYKNYQNLYAEVLEQTERERIGRVGDEKDVISFNIIDPPAVSLDPVAPPRGLFLLGVLFAGIAAAFGTAFFFWQLKPTYSDQKELIDELGLPVLGTISINFRNIGHSRMTHVVKFGLACGLLMVCFVGIYVAQDQVMSVLRQLSI